MSASVAVEGFIAALERWGGRTAQATQAGTEDAIEVVREAIQANLTRSYYPPVSEPGEPPAWRTGYLHDRVYAHTLPVDGGWQGRAYPSTVYARIHELSGWAGRDHKSFLPARPYVQPASDETAPEVGRIFAQAWRDALPAT